MKKFLELLDTEIYLPVKIILEPITDNGIPYCMVSINNNKVFDNQLEEQLSINELIKLKDNLVIEITMKQKKYSSDKETAIKFLCFSIDNREIFPYHTSNITYTNDQNFEGKSFYLGFNGVWKYEISKPFYQWYHVTSGQGWLLEPR